MFNDEIRKMLVEVISSWQVLAVTAALVIYFGLVNYAARVYRKKRRPRMPKIKPEAQTETATDDLGLEDNTRR